MWLAFEDSSIQFISEELSESENSLKNLSGWIHFRKSIFRLSINQPVMYFSVKLGFGCNFQDTKEKGFCKILSFPSFYFTFLFLKPSFETQEAFSTDWKFHLIHNGLLVKLECGADWKILGIKKVSENWNVIKTDFSMPRAFPLAVAT